MDPTKCTLARIRRILETRRDDGARALIHALRTAPADTDDAIHVLVPLEKADRPWRPQKHSTPMLHIFPDKCADGEVGIDEFVAALRRGQHENTSNFRLALRNRCAVRSESDGAIAGLLGSSDVVHSPLGERGTQRSRLQGLVQH